jgi:hypothetical protein
MSKLISLKDFDKKSLLLLLTELGYKSDGIYVLDKNENRILDKYLETPIEINNMVIFPGSVIILDDNEYSINMYLEEYQEKL